MKEEALFTQNLRDPVLAQRLLASIQKKMSRLNRRINFMEVCGTHTVAISRSGLRRMLPQGLTLLSGPGCPVCVTDQRDIDTLIELARLPGVIITTFGDMMRVPGTVTSLQEEKAMGADVRVVYSPLDALEVARQNPRQKVIFYGVGFETTAPMVAAALEMAVEEGLENFLVFSVHKTVPQALEALASSAELALDGFILPGHVSTVIGMKSYQDVARRHRLPSVISGFEPLDILLTVDMLLTQVEEGRGEVENEYRRAVTWEGNRVAQAVVEKFFLPVDAVWRGLGVIPHSGLELRPEWNKYNARLQFPVEELVAKLPPPSKLMQACSCGEVLKGLKLPPQCALFGKACTPARPVGPCMVSTEGSCAAYYRYERIA